MEIQSKKWVTESHTIGLTDADLRVIDVALRFLSDELTYGISRPYRNTYTGSDICRLSAWYRRAYLKSEAEQDSLSKLSHEDIHLLIFAIEQGVTLKFLEWHILAEVSREKEMSEDFHEMYGDEGVHFNFEKKVDRLRLKYLPVIQFKASVLSKLNNKFALLSR